MAGETAVEKYLRLLGEKPEDTTSTLSDAMLELGDKEYANLKAIATKRGLIATKPVASSSETGKQGRNTLGTTETGESSGKGKEKEKESGPQEGVSLRDFAAEAKLVEQFWTELEGMDVISLVSEGVIDDFRYMGFDPSTIVLELMKRGKQAKKNKEQIMSDIVHMVTIAIIKGSITDNNLKKTSDTGKVFYKNLQSTYGLVTGGVRGRDSSVLTVARVAAAVPGMVMQILIDRPQFGKTFVGPFNSKSLPVYLRHQAAAACIPEGLASTLKEFLIGLITAFTADQTKSLAKTKDQPEELYNKQLAFVTTTHSSRYPSEKLRKSIFAKFSLASDYSKLHAVAVKIKSVVPEFVVMTLTEINDDLSKLQ